ncbi:diguanylate cyclase (GGDEF)-like protein/PAS domain S-box-containing protein [Methylopila capsulata]|nr:diguanylate cyclase [Methylopila capsulata]MBM7852222.1 diguanylate cyclase (GGDEF)-like protein/PAS domain S-box-containing protein [Methylopila capsulata]
MGVAVVWPATAVAIGMLIVWGRPRPWPEVCAIGLANASVHYALDGELLFSAVHGVANGLTVLTTCIGLRWTKVGTGAHSTVRKVVRLFFVAAAAPIPGALIGGVATASVQAAADPLHATVAWWLVEAVNFILLVPPFLFWRLRRERLAARLGGWGTRRKDTRRRRLRRLELGAASIALAVAGVLVPITGELALIELSATVLLWFALRFGAFATALTATIFAVCVTGAAFFDFWPDVTDLNRSSVLLPLQAMLALTTVPALLVAVIMSERRRELAALDRDAQRLAFALEGANDGLWDWHVPMGEGFFSPRACRMFGYEPAEFARASAWDALVHPDDLAKARAAFGAHAAGQTAFYEAEMRCRHKTGDWVWVLDRGKIVQRDAQGHAVRAVGTLTDISERKNLEQALEHLATHDPLTGLANRGVFERGLLRSSARLDRMGGRIAVVLIDLDHFKQVNDTFGHAAGDALLQETAIRLRTSARADDLVARLGGDEFAIIASGQTAAEFDTLAERLCAVLAEPVFGVGFEVTPSVSIGVAVAGVGAQVDDDLVVRADRALYAAKKAGRGTWRFFGAAGRVA